MKKLIFVILFCAIGLNTANAFDRKYSVEEIVVMRSYLEHQFLYGDPCGPKTSGFSRTYTEDELNNYVEPRLRTLMMNGTEPHEIIKGHWCDDEDGKEK